jgi:hypothetical protein
VKLSSGEARFPNDLRAFVVDQFNEPTLYDLKKPTTLCNPVDKEGEGVKDLDTHLLCYQAIPVPKLCASDAPTNPFGACKREQDCGGTPRQTSFCQRQPKHEKVLDLEVSNQFGSERLDTVRVEELCVPSAKNHRPAVAEPAAHGIVHCCPKLR